MRKRFALLLTLLLLLPAVGCGEIPLPSSSDTSPTADWPAGVPTEPTAIPLYETDIPYPIPTRVIPTPRPPVTPEPTVLSGPALIVLGAEMAPAEERVTYISSTVVVAPVGDGPGQLGWATFGPEPPAKAEEFRVDGYGNIFVLDRLNGRVAQFTAEGKFVQNISYGGKEKLPYPTLLAVDQKGLIYLYDEGHVPEEAAVYCYNQKGVLQQRFPAPAWFAGHRVRTMRVDEQGILWVEGEGPYPGAPVIQDAPYPVVVVPLGSSTAVLDEEQQKSAAVPGMMCNTGTYLSYTSPSSAEWGLYLYDREGNPIYDCPGCTGRFQTDRWNNLYLTSTGVRERTVIRYDARGMQLAAVNLPIGSIRIAQDGTIYCLVMDETKQEYRVIRWQQK